MKVPVGIDLSRASFALCQLNKKVSFTMEGSFGSGVGKSNGPITPFKIISSASTARGNCDWDKAAIFSKNRSLIGVSSFSHDSSFILITSCGTCATNISGKLCRNNERLQLVKRGVTYEKEKVENTSSTISQWARLSWMCTLALCLRVGISY